MAAQFDYGTMTRSNAMMWSARAPTTAREGACAPRLNGIVTSPTRQRPGEVQEASRYGHFCHPCRGANSQYTIFRGCRCAQPPATLLHPSGIGSRVLSTAQRGVPSLLEHCLSQSAGWHWRIDGLGLDEIGCHECSQSFGLRCSAPEGAIRFRQSSQ